MLSNWLQCNFKSYEVQNVKDIFYSNLDFLFFFSTWIPDLKEINDVDPDMCVHVYAIQVQLCSVLSVTVFSHRGFLNAHRVL